jgi:hypothetical protein
MYFPATSFSLEVLVRAHRGQATALDRRAARPSFEVAAMIEANLPKGRIGRSVRLAQLAGHTMANRANTRVHACQGSRAAEAEERARQERLAKRYAEVLGDMKGAVMKVGQILSFVDADGVFPGPHRQLFQSTLARLQDDVHSGPTRSLPSSGPSSERPRKIGRAGGGGVHRPGPLCPFA